LSTTISFSSDVKYQVVLILRSNEGTNMYRQSRACFSVTYLWRSFYAAIDSCNKTIIELTSSLCTLHAKLVDVPRLHEEFKRDPNSGPVCSSSNFGAKQSKIARRRYKTVIKFNRFVYYTATNSLYSLLKQLLIMCLRIMRS